MVKWVTPIIGDISWNINDFVDKAIYDTQDMYNVKPYDLDRKMFHNPFTLKFPMSGSNQDISYISYQYECDREFVTFTVGQLLQEIKIFYDSKMTTDEITFFITLFSNTRHFQKIARKIKEAEKKGKSIERRVLLGDYLMFVGLWKLGGNEYKIILNN